MPALARRSGRLVKLTGDGALVEFPSAIDALSAAIEFQQAMAEANRDQPEHSAVTFRVGVHLGDLIVDGDDLYGDSVNVAARLEAAAPAGGIVVSSAVNEAIAGRLKAAFRDLGPLALKNIERPVSAYGIEWNPTEWKTAAAGATTVAKVAPPPLADSPLALPDKPSIAVLPFQNMSGDPEQEYFSDGMVEEITTALCRMRWLFVIARNSSFTYKGKAVNIRDVGRELGVRYVLEGSVRKAANRVRITAQLIDAGSGAQLWADRFDGTLEDIFDLHDRVAMEIAGAVEPNLREAEIHRSLRKPTTSLDAYDAYMRAMAAFRDPSPESMRSALELTQRALDQDPTFARALALRANCVMHLGERFGPDSVAEALRLSHAALTATTDDSDATSIAAMTIALAGGDIDMALSASQRAVALNPNGYWAHMHNGWIQCAAGHPDTAIEPFSQSLRLSPRDIFRGYAELGLSIAHRDVGHPGEALAWGRRAMLAMPRLSGGYRAVAAALVDLGRVDEAKAMIRQLLAVLPHARIDPAFVHRQNRNEAMAQSTITALRAAGLPD
jgi:TolB-like protein